MLMRSQHWAFSALFNAQSCMFLLAWATKVRSRGPMCWWPCTAKKIPMRCITCINKKLPALMWSIICLMRSEERRVGKECRLGGGTDTLQEIGRSNHGDYD